jgi:hypothetical protein
MHVYMHIYALMNIHIHVNAYISTQTCITCTHKRTCICNVHMYVCTHIHTHTHTWANYHGHAGSRSSPYRGATKPILRLLQTTHTASKRLIIISHVCIRKNPATWKIDERLEKLPNQRTFPRGLLQPSRLQPFASRTYFATCTTMCVDIACERFICM